MLGILRNCPWMEVAVHLLGTREVKGPQHSAAILRMWESIKAPFRDDEVPWCAAFVGHCLEAREFPSTRSAAARSYVKWGTEVVGPYSAAYGAVVILNRPGNSWSGHVAFLTGYDARAEVFQLLGGNQDNQVKYSEYPASRVVDVRWPVLWPPYIGSYLVPKPGLPCPPFTARGNRSRSDA